MKRSKRYFLLLLVLCSLMSGMVFIWYLFVCLILAILGYFKTGEFIFDINDLYLAFKLGSVGILWGILTWLYCLYNEKYH